MFSTPPHTAHKLHLLNMVLMKPFKGAYFESCLLRMSVKSGARITEYEITSILTQAVTLLNTVKSGFHLTGILPLNPNIYTDLDFLPPAATDIPMQSVIDKNVCNDAYMDTSQDRLQEAFNVHLKENGHNRLQQKRELTTE